MADLTFVDADYLNFLAAEDARLDPTGTNTPRLDGLLGSSGEVVITSTIVGESTSDLSFDKDRVLSAWISQNASSGNVRIVSTSESPGANGGTFNGQTIGGGEASIQNYIDTWTSQNDTVNIYSNNLGDYSITQQRPSTNLSGPFQSLGEMLYNGEISLSQYDDMALAFQNNGVTPQIDAENGGFSNFPTFLFDGFPLQITSSDGSVIGTITRTGNGLLIEDNVTGATRTVGYNEASPLFGDNNGIGIGIGQECFGPEVPIDMWPLDPDLKPGPDGIYDQDAVRAKVWKKPIKLIQVGDLVVSFDDDGNLVPGPVTRTFQNNAKILLNFHGTRVTPGHVYYRPDSKKSYKYETLIDVLRDDGVIQKQDGTLIRAATNVPVDSPRDGFVRAIAGRRKADGTFEQTDEGRIRLGTRFLVGDGEERKSFAVADLIERNGGVVGEDKLIHVGDGPGVPLTWDFGDTLPKPEDFVLACSGTTLEDIYKAAEWESQGPRLPAPMVLDRGPVQPLKGAALSAMPRNEPLNVAHAPVASAKPQRTLNRKQRKAMEAKQRKAAKTRKRVAV